MSRIATIAGTGVLLILLLGCSVKIPTYENIKIDRSSLHTSKEKALAAAFARYWKARSDGNYKECYKYELPYQKYTMDYENYKKRIGKLYEKAVIRMGNIEYITPNIAIVTREVRIGKKFYRKKDKWIYVDRKWYHKFYQNILPSLKDAKYQ